MNLNLLADFWKKRSVQIFTSPDTQTKKLKISEDSSGKELPTQEQRLRDLVLSPNNLIGSRVTHSEAFTKLKEAYSKNFIEEDDHQNIKLNFIQNILYKSLNQYFTSANQQENFRNELGLNDDAQNNSFTKNNFQVLHNASLENFLADLYRRTYKFTENNYNELGLKGASSPNNVAKSVVKNLSGGLDNLDNRPKVMHLFYEAFIKAVKFSSQHHLSQEESTNLIKERLDRIVPIIKYIEAIDENEAPIEDIKKKSILNMLILKNSALEHLEQHSELFTNIAQKIDQSFTAETKNKQIFETYNLYQERDDYINFKRDIAKVYLHFATQTTKLNDPLSETLNVANKFVEIYPTMKAERNGLSPKSLRSFLFQYLKTAKLDLAKDELIRELKNSEAYKKRLSLQSLIPATERKKSDGLKQYAQRLAALNEEERDILAVRQASEALMRLEHGLLSEKNDYMDIYLKTIIETTNKNRKFSEREIQRDPSLSIMGQHLAKVLEIMRGKHELSENLNPQILAKKISDAFLERLKDVQIAPKAVLISKRLEQYSKIAIAFLGELSSKVNPLFDLRSDKDLINQLKKVKVDNISTDKSVPGDNLYALHRLNNLLVKIALVTSFSDEKIELFIKNGNLPTMKAGQREAKLFEKSKNSNEANFLNNFFKAFSDSSDKFLPNLFKAREAFKEALSSLSSQNNLLGLDQSVNTIDAKNLISKTIYQFIKNNKEEVSINPANIPLEYSDGSTRELASHDQDLDPFPEGTFRYYINKVNNYHYDELKPILKLFATEAKLSQFTTDHKQLFPSRSRAENFLSEDELNEFKLVTRKYLEAAENGDFYSESVSEKKNIANFINEHLKNNNQLINGLVDNSFDFEQKIRRYIVVARMLLACDVKKDGLAN